jgi:hypothetical protein
VRAAALGLQKLLLDKALARAAAVAGAAPLLLELLRWSQSHWTKQRLAPPPATAARPISHALADLVQAAPRVALQLLEAGAAPLLVSLISPPSRQVQALVQRGGWAEDLEEAQVAAAGLVLSMGSCFDSPGGEAETARRALRGAGVMEALLGLLRRCTASSSWGITAEALGAMMDLGGSSGRPVPSEPLLGPDDDAALEALLQALLHARDPVRQETAARVLMVALSRSSSGGAEGAVLLAERGALRRARELAASSGDGKVRASAARLVDTLEELLLVAQQGAAGEGAAANDEHGRRQQEAAAAGTPPIGAAASSSVCAACGAAKASGGAKLRRCAGCRAVRYCSPACQKAHWRQHRAACEAAQRAQG